MTSENTGWGLGVERSELEMPADNDRMSTIRAKPWPNAKTQMSMRQSRGPMMSHIRTDARPTGADTWTTSTAGV